MEIEVNGTALDGGGDLGASLLDVLRANGLTGAKEACGRGECGACTVLVGDRPVVSCLALAALVREPVTTVEGLDADDLRESFADAGAFQCGFCTPGQLVRAEALLRERERAASGTDALADLDEASVRYELSGNVCRCTGYTQIVDAVLMVARRRATNPRTGEAHAGISRVSLTSSRVDDEVE